MAAYKILAQQPIALVEDSTLIPYSKKSLLPTHRIKKLLKSVRNLFTKPKVAPAPFNGDSSFVEILPHEYESVPGNFFTEEECENLENERREAQMLAAAAAAASQ